MRDDHHVLHSTVLVLQLTTSFFILYGRSLNTVPGIYTKNSTSPKNNEQLRTKSMDTNFRILFKDLKLSGKLCISDFNKLSSLISSPPKTCENGLSFGFDESAASNFLQLILLFLILFALFSHTFCGLLDIH